LVGTIQHGYVLNAAAEIGRTRPKDLKYRSDRTYKPKA
jgi:hypothetical protein